MKLYVSLDYKDKEEIVGSIFNLPRKKEQIAIYLYFKGVRKSDTAFKLDIYRPAFTKHYEVMLDEIIECKMTAKDILFYVDQRIEHLIKVLYGERNESTRNGW